jgi:hypothetical protein
MIQIHHDIEAASVTSLKTQSPSERRDGDCGFPVHPGYSLRFNALAGHIIHCMGTVAATAGPISPQSLVTRQSQKRNKIIASGNF